MSSPSLQFLYQALSRPKDKMDSVLEPLQAMIQLALLSVSPPGTKLCLQENILSIQPPTIIQPLTRWYHADKKDDLYFLYSVIKRYIKWYHPTLNKKSPMSMELYRLLTAMATEGLNMLFNTYRSSDSNTVIHVIQMYKNLLEFNNDQILVDEYIVNIDQTKINMDEVFEKITAVYDPIILQVIYQVLTLIHQEHDAGHQQYNINGLNQLLHKYHHAITTWIKTNLLV